MYSYDQLIQRAEIERDIFRKEYDEWAYVPEKVSEVSERIICVLPSKETRFIITRPADDDGSALPAYVNLHGGGFTIGSPELEERFCHKTANETHCVTINVDYGLAPEYRFPIAVEECYSVLQWIHKNATDLNINDKKIALGGHSAGANLAAVASILAIERGGFLPCCQILDCAPFYLNDSPPFDGFDDGLELPMEKLSSFFRACYFSDLSEATDPKASPLYAQNLHGLPPTLIVTAGKDRRKDGAERFAGLLRNSGVSVVYKCFEKSMHGFTVEPDKGPHEEAVEAWSLINSYIREHFTEE